MADNNFKELMREDEEHFLRVHDDNVRQEISRRMQFLRLVGELVEMYLPRPMDVLVMAMSDQEAPETGMETDQSSPPDESPSETPDDEA